MLPQLQREAPVTTPAVDRQWSLPLRVAFRFLFCYFILYVFPRCVGSRPAGDSSTHIIRLMWRAVVPWVGVNILHINGDYREVANGSGDQLFDFVLLFCIAVVALAATAIWSSLDRKRPNYENLSQWLRFFMRIVVAVAMISYGANKIWRSQFPEPALATYITTWGQTSRMRLLWNMMGTSRAYSFFGGFGEVSGAILLLLPRFTALGALITGAVMTNVLLINIGYDVPRKIYSIHLIAFCLILLIPDIRNLINFFVLNRPARLSPPVPLFADKKLNYGASALLAGIGIAALVYCSMTARLDQKKHETHVAASLRGIWTVDEFSIDGAPHPALLTDKSRWNHVVFDETDVVAVQLGDGRVVSLVADFAGSNDAVTLWDPQRVRRIGNLKIDLPQPEQMALQAEVDGHQYVLSLQRMNLSDPVAFPLLNRKIKWLNPDILPY